jgi:hypothetical protein
MIWLIYPLNGLLALLWLAVDHALAVILIAPLAWLCQAALPEQRPWSLAAAGLALLSAAISPPPVPALMLVMALAGSLAVRLESFNPTATRWNVARGLGLYGLAGLGFRAYQDLAPLAADGSPLLAQGQIYLSALAAFAMYLIPLAYLALLAQSLWAHPPLPGSPAAMTHAIRARGKQ